MRLRTVRAPGGGCRPHGGRSLRGGACAAWTGESCPPPRRVDLERVGGRVVVPRRPELESGRLRQRVGGDGVVHAAITNSRGGWEQFGGALCAEPICEAEAGVSPRRPRRRWSSAVAGGWSCTGTAHRLRRKGGVCVSAAGRTLVIPENMMIPATAMSRAAPGVRSSAADQNTMAVDVAITPS